jgi:hypothetical protein
MREIVDFRINERYFERLFAPHEGKRLGDMVCQIDVETSDPRFQQIGEMEKQVRAETEGREFFFSYAGERRVYTRAELEAAEILGFGIWWCFEPAGEDCGTIYDESAVCPHCGAGRRQISDLVLDLRKAPKRKDMACTIADEWIVSQRLAEIMLDAGLTGFELRPVRHKARYIDDPIDLNWVPAGRELLRRATEAGIPPPPSGEFLVWLNRPEQAALNARADREYVERREKRAARRGKPPPVWHQLVITAPPVSMVPPTRFGVDVFDDDAAGEFRCPLGHVAGLNLLSEVSVVRSEWDGSDVFCTQQLVGTRRGVLVPRPELLISQRCWKLLREHRTTGWAVDVAHLV